MKKAITGDPAKALKELLTLRAEYKRIWKKHKDQLNEARFRFNEDDREHLDKVLRRYESKKVEQFITRLESYWCTGWKILSHEQDWQSHRIQMEAMLGSFKNSLRYIKKVYWRDLDTDFLAAISNTEFDRVVESAQTVRPHLEHLIATIETYIKRTKRGRGHPGSKRYDLAEEIGVDYWRSFDKRPTTTRNGPFHQVIWTVFKGLNLFKGDPYESDPYKYVNEAVRRLKANPPR